MATVTGFTAQKMQEIIADNIISAEIVGDNLILTTRDGTPIDAGVVRGDQGPEGPPGPGAGSVIVKPSDESVVSSTTYQADDHLLDPILPNVTKLYILGVTYSMDTNDVKARITIPTGATIRGSVVAINDTLGVSLLTDLTAGWLSGGMGAANLLSFIGHFLVINGANAGNVALQWAQSVSSTTAATVKAGSFLSVVEVT